MTDTTTDWPQIRLWREQRRAALIAARMNAPAAQRREWSAAIDAMLRSGFDLLAGMTIGCCWPYRNEFDARFTMRYFRERGATGALPAVIAKGTALQFRKWWPGAPMKPGVYGIPVPDATEVVVPHAAIVPMNGFDGQGYRLGYGGGYFDRTLAALAPRPLTIGVAFELARVPTIRPQPHDIAMDFVVTEAGLHAVTESGLAPVGAEECRVRARRVCDERGIPYRRPCARATAGYSSPPCYAAEFPGYFGEGGGRGND